jgi:maltodextrin utilization protein YvdJ
MRTNSTHYKSILINNGTSLLNSISKGISYGLPVYSWIKDTCLFFFVFIKSLFMIVLYVHYSSTQAFPINLILSNVEGFIL